jgi:nitroimidazol reductase NimA-like FMN-containing flavoprotein (pyridoxamine 5'-phosphate oxidase superfamily)
MSDHPADLETLDRADCFALLASVEIGRIAVSQAGWSPLVGPVNFRLDGEVVVFRLDPGATLRGLHQHVSFQTDAIDPVHHTGWSVLVQGIAYEASAEEVRDVDLEPWAPGAKEHWIRLVAGSVTGRRLRFAVDQPDARAYL